jgi:hypothetical protein
MRCIFIMWNFRGACPTAFVDLPPLLRWPPDRGAAHRPALRNAHLNMTDRGMKAAFRRCIKHRYR